MKFQMSKKHFSLFCILFITFIAGLLRLPLLSHFPPALYSDEVSQGYNAYSVYKTGRDEYGTLLPVSFRSFGDWKPPLQTYLMIPTIAFFGLNEYGIRLPGALLGTFTVFIVFFLVKEILDYYKVTNKTAVFISLCSSLLLATSPWHIYQSRAAMLTGVELFCVVSALLAFFKGLHSQRWLIVSALFWAFSIYSYYAMRLIAPLFIAVLFCCFRKQLKWRMMIVPAVSMGIILLPLVLMFFKNPDVVFGRAKTVSIFYDQGTALTVWDHSAQDGQQAPVVITQFFHNKPSYYAREILRRFFQHFDGNFLFLTGDANPPFTIAEMGLLYLVDGLLIFGGLVWLIRYQQKLLIFLLCWIGISILPASLTFMTPSANRTFTMVVPLLFISALGGNFIYDTFKKYRLFLSVIIISLYVINFGYFLYQYTVVLPKDYAHTWHFGYKELYSYLNTQENNYKKIYISAKASVPYIFLLYNKVIDPNLVQKNTDRNFTLDEFGFEHVNAYGEKYLFPRKFSWEKNGERLGISDLLVLTPNEIVGENVRLINIVEYPNHTPAFKIYSIR